jgi:hypothetical protein
MKLDRALRITAARLLWAQGLGSAAALLLTAAVAVAGAAVFDYVWPLPAAVRTGVLAVLAIDLVRRLRAILRLARTRLDLAARSLDRRGGAGRVRGAFELVARREEIAGSDELKQAEIDAVEALVAEGDLPRPDLRRPLRIAVLWALCFGILLCFGSGTVSYQVRRVVLPLSGIPPLAGEHFTWVWPPESFRVPHGERVRVELLIPDVAEKPAVVVRGADRTVHPLGAAGGSRWTAAIGPLAEDAVLEARDGPFTSEPRRIAVAPAAAIRAVTFVLTFPAYTGTPPRRVSVESGRIAVLRGTSVEIRVAADRAGDGGAFVFRTGDRPLVRGELAREGGELTGELLLVEGGELELSVGPSAASRRTIVLECIDDRPPEILVTFPPRLLVACAGSEVPIEVDARDDFGLAEVRAGTSDREWIHRPGGKRRLGVRELLAVPETGAFTARITARATDVRAPVPQTSAADPRTVRAVNRDTFTLLRRIDGLAALKRRLEAIRARTEALLALVEPEADAAPLLGALAQLEASVTELEQDPIFGQEKRLTGPILERAAGLRKLARSGGPPAGAEDRRAWFMFVGHFARELLEILDQLLPQAGRLAEAQPYVQVLARVFRLPEREDAVYRALQAEDELAPVKLRQERIKADVQSLGRTVGEKAPEGLAELAAKLAAILAEPALHRAIDGALEAMEADNRAQARDEAARARELLRPIRDAIAARGAYAKLDLLELLAAIGEGRDAAAAQNLEVDLVVLWGPGAGTSPPEAEPPPVRAGAVTVAAPGRPEILRGDPTFYDGLIEAYRAERDRLLGPRGGKEREP